MRPLIDLIRALPQPLAASFDSASIQIHSVTCDSRHVVPGALYVAIRGEKTDGAEFIADAIARGAAAILCDSGVSVQAAVPVLRTANVRHALAHVAAAFYPRQPQTIVAVTGTDGKTSTADFTRQLWVMLGYKAASIGTLGTIGEHGQELYPGTHTTPDPTALHKMLQELHDDGYTHIAMEASSHGLDQHRLDGVRIRAAAFTNLTRDHLDYHKTEEAYFAAKARLFQALLPVGGTAVLNQDDAMFGALRDMAVAKPQRVIGFGRKGKEMCLSALKLQPHGQRATFELFGKSHAVDIPLVGAFQTMNMLAALALVTATGADLEKALAAIPKLKGVPGRLERVATLANGAAVYIDYAHTPAALANILKTLRPHTQNKLHVVFGCGGDRDAGKRPEMGRIACELADRVIVTDDNPRHEDPAAIRRAILAAAPTAKEVADRKEAIYVAVQELSAGDVLVIAGKGHETTQTIGDQQLPFDDAEITRRRVRELGIAA
jgi:UDP-N-acetylmuramoyl-L-alanyl-D-glutamate--2,6-diaminopimelate ligase